jgi:phosphate transport system permease protein
VSVVPATQELTGHRRIRDWLGDRVMFGLTLLAALVTVAIMVAIAYKVVRGAELSFRAFGLSFVWDSVWDTNKAAFGAAPFLFGTAVTSLIALLIATPLAIAIALFLSELAPRGARVVVGSLVELLAAIPSVVLGLWGILVFGPWLDKHLEPWLHDVFGFLPMFSGSPNQGGLLPAALVLTIMIVPITSAICRELFLRVPRELVDGSLALGSTRWESIRGVALPYAAPGIAAAVLLGLGRAFGEAIAVAQVSGGGNAINASWFAPVSTLGSKIALEYQGAASAIQASSILYLAAILMVISLVTNVVAQLIVLRFEKARRGV